jgi:hypothetical protein
MHTASRPVRHHTGHCVIATAAALKFALYHRWAGTVLGSGYVVVRLRQKYCCLFLVWIAFHVWMKDVDIMIAVTKSDSGA